MGIYLVKTPEIISKIFKSQTWHLSREKKTLFLTFDDGPTPDVTPWVLNLLKKYQAKATFFCIGRNLVKYPDLFQKIQNEGHSVGNHTYDHANGWKTTKQDYIQSILKTDAIIQKGLSDNLKKQAPKLFRPPYGRIRRSQSRALVADNYWVIMWSVLSADFDKNIPAGKCLTNVLSNARSGDIVVFHDSLKAYGKLKAILPKVLEHFSERGYNFKRIEKMEQVKRIAAQD